ncbi:type IV pilin protein [Salibacter halophilus]|uniref:Type II secretion system protein n=1 Tax=Salibacter halophilus TaxID=1803916 RepID=A0A6N6M3D0_9FLAO|nr:type II secretion system protein [Salibacter halophilus]KAB1061960.1 type II secretion system protein [Salibacter halophilus]
MKFNNPIHTGTFNCKTSKSKLAAWTLMEVLLVLAIVGILVLLALPNFTSIISKAKGKEAELQLNALHMMQKTHFYEKSKYGKTLESVGFQQEKLTTEGGKANYKIEIVEASNTGYTARATAVVDFDGDGQYNVWEIDEDKNLEEVTKD